MLGLLELEGDIEPGGHLLDGVIDPRLPVVWKRLDGEFEKPGSQLNAAAPAVVINVAHGRFVPRVRTRFRTCNMAAMRS